MEKPNALFIHGFKGSSNSRTGAALRETLKDKFNVIIPAFNIIAIDETLAKIDEIVKTENIQLLTGTSLGAFYVLCYKTSLPKIIINPCMIPSETAPQFDPKVSPKIIERTRELETEIYSQNAPKNNRVIGLFATADELFGEKYKPLFAKHYGEENIFSFEGGHHAGDKTHDALLAALAKLELE